MNKALTLLAAAATIVVANIEFAPSAAAGGGVRLHFGFPLGSFVARPCSSCGGSSSYGHRSHGGYASERRAAARRAAIAAAKAERAAAARRAAIAEAKEEKAAARRAALAEARRKDRLAKLQADEKEVAKTEVTSIAPDYVPLPARAETQDGEVTVGEPKMILSNGKKAEAEKVAAAPVETVASRQVSRVEPRAKPTDCKKFVPSAGLTITVPCQ